MFSRQSSESIPYWLYGGVIFLLLAGSLGGENFASIDLWGKLSIPALWLSSHVFPTHDPFSFTALGSPWTDHEWLSGFAFYYALLWGGDIGLTLLKGGMVALMTAAVFAVARLRQTAAIFPFLILLIGLPMLVSGLMATGRPQLFTFSFIPVLLLLLEMVRIHGRYWLLSLCVPFFLLWANLHGGFVAGLGIMGCYAVGEALNKRPFLPFLAAMMLSVLVSLLNPYGLEYWRYLLYAITLPRPDITEWQPVMLWNFSFLPLKLLGVLTACGFLVASWQRERQRWDSVLWLLFPILMWQAFGHIKHQPIFVLTLAALCPAVGAVSPKDFIPEWIKVCMNRVLPAIGLLGALIWVGILWNGKDPLQVQVRSEAVHKGGLPYKPYPVGAVRYLEQSPYHGNLFTPFSWGEFAYWVLYPRFRISMDGRLEAVYPMRLFRQGETFYRSRKPQSWRIPETLGATFILSEQNVANLRFLLRTGRWVLLYQDQCYAVLGKKSVVETQGAVGATGKASPHPVILPVSAFFQPERFLPRFRAFR